MGIIRNYMLYVPGNISDPGDKAVRKTGKGSCPHGAYILVGETDNNQVSKTQNKLDSDNSWEET